MNDLIPQDLIKFVEANRPEVLPDILMVINLHAKTRLQSECEKIISLWNKLDGSNYRISEDHAAALLVNWLIDKLRDYNINMQWAGGTWYVTFEDDEGFTVLEKTTSLIPLPALWQAYKKVKGIKE